LGAVRRPCRVSRRRLVSRGRCGRRRAVVRTCATPTRPPKWLSSATPCLPTVCERNRATRIRNGWIEGALSSGRYATTSRGRRSADYDDTTTAGPPPVLWRNTEQTVVGAEAESPCHGHIPAARVSAVIRPESGPWHCGGCENCRSALPGIGRGVSSGDGRYHVSIDLAVIAEPADFMAKLLD